MTLLIQKNVLFLIFIFISGFINAQDSLSVLTLEEAFRIGLTNSFAIQIASTQKEISEANHTLGNAGALPSVTFNVGQTYGLNSIRQEFATGSVSEKANAQSFNTTVGLSARWVVFDGLRMFITYNRLSELIKLSDLSVKINAESTLNNIAINYFNLLQQEQQLISLKTNLLLSKQIRELAKDRFEIGTGAKSDYLKAQIDFNIDSASIIRQEQLIKGSKIQLNRALTREVFTAFEINDSIVVNTSFRIETLLEISRNNNMSIRIAQQNQTISKLLLQETKSTKYPTVSLTGDYNLLRAQSEAGLLLRNTNYGFTVGILASFNLYNGLNRKRLEQVGELNLKIAQSQIQDLNNQLESGLLQAYNIYLTNLKLAALERLNLALVLQNVGFAFDRYKIGVTTPLELRQAQQDVLDTKLRLINANYGAKLAEIEMIRLSGGFVQTLK